MPKKACVIGAGSAGLSAIKNLKEYGFDVICYEKRNEIIGGLWNFSEEVPSTVMRKTILNTSKEFNTFSDFPMSNDALPNFLPNYQLQEYFEEYSKNFNLKLCIQFNTSVIEVKKSKTYEIDGTWDVTTEHELTKTRDTMQFSYVMVCNGHHVKPHIPTYPGIDQFKGGIYHSSQCKTSQRFYNRNVLIVGLGNSGGDIACELARTAKQVYVSTRHGTWVTRRVVKQGYPRDVTRSRFMDHIQKISPNAVKRFVTNRDYTNFFDHSLYGLQPTELPGQSPVLLADDLPLHLSSGYIKIRNGINRFESNSVVYSNDIEEHIDDIIFCTGFNFDFDFIRENDKPFIEVDDNQLSLYLRIFSPDDKHHTLGIIGLIDPMGPTTTVSEMQSRMCAHIWANRVKLPSRTEMIECIQEEKRKICSMFKCSARKASLQVPFIHYMDQLASIIGCIPSIKFIQDPQLAYMLYWGPVTPSHYRLVGPHKWNGARKHILDTFKRVHRGMNPVSVGEVSTRPSFELIFGHPLIYFLIFQLVLILSLLLTMFIYSGTKSITFMIVFSVLYYFRS